MVKDFWFILYRFYEDFWFILYRFYVDLSLPLGGGLEGDYKLAELNFRWGPNSMVGSEHTFDKQVSIIYH